MKEQLHLGNYKGKPVFHTDSNGLWWSGFMFDQVNTEDLLSMVRSVEKDIMALSHTITDKSTEDLSAIKLKEHKLDLCCIRPLGSHLDINSKWFYDQIGLVEYEYIDLKNYKSWENDWRTLVLQLSNNNVNLLNFSMSLLKLQPQKYDYLISKDDNIFVRLYFADI